MSGMNKAIICGNLGQDPEVRYTQSGQAVCNFSVATSESWKDKQSGEKTEKTEWHRIVVWGPQAENCGKYLAKGRQVLVEGRIQTRKWQDKDGADKYTTEIVAQTVQFLSGGSGERQQSQQGGGQQWGGNGGGGGGGGYQPGPPQPQQPPQQQPYGGPGYGGPPQQYGGPPQPQYPAPQGYPAPPQGGGYPGGRHPDDDIPF